MLFAIVSAAPVFSRIVPIIVPQRMTIPMFARMLPKPLLTVLITLTASKPQTSPIAIAMTTITMNGWMLNLEMAIIIATTAIKITPNMNNADMLLFLPVGLN